MKELMVKLADLRPGIFKMSSRNYRLLADQKKVPKPEKGKIPLYESIGAVIEYYQKIARREGEKLTDMRTRKVAAEAGIKEMEE